MPGGYSRSNPSLQVLKRQARHAGPALERKPCITRLGWAFVPAMPQTPDVGEVLSAAGWHYDDIAQGWTRSPHKPHWLGGKHTAAQWLNWAKRRIESIKVRVGA